MIVKIKQWNNKYNWIAYDKIPLPIYGKVFKTKREAVKDWKKFVKTNNIKKWKYENIWRILWNRIVR